jgi:hypothetical protein
MSIFAASLLCLHPRSTTREAKLVRIHEGKHWVWFACADQFENYKQDIERFYDNGSPRGLDALLQWDYP